MSLCQRECSLCNLKLHCQGCSLCEMPFCKRQCNKCFSLCPKRNGSFAYLKKLGGGEVLLAPNESHKLPGIIPVLPDRLTEKMHVRDIIGIHGGNMLSSNGENVARVYQNKGLQGALNLEKEIKGVLQFYVKDRTLEGVWDNRKNIYKQLKEFPWRVIISPNFSVYEDAPRIDHLYNIKRSSIMYNEMLEEGLPAVPDVSWYNRIDLDQWIREINKKEISCIAFSFQTVDTRSKASNTYLHYMMGYKYLVDRISTDVEIILAGLVSSKRVQILKRESKHKLSILNQSAFVQSRRGILSEEMVSAPLEMSKNEIMMRNIDYYEKAYEVEAEGGADNA